MSRSWMSRSWSSSSLTAFSWHWNVSWIGPPAAGLPLTGRPGPGGSRVPGKERLPGGLALRALADRLQVLFAGLHTAVEPGLGDVGLLGHAHRSEEHTSELPSLMRISYAVFCLQKKNTHPQHHI